MWKQLALARCPPQSLARILLYRRQTGRRGAHVPLFVPHQELQLMPIGIVKIDAVRIVGSAAHFDASFFKRRFDALIIAYSQTQRHVINFAAGMDVFVIIDFKESYALVATFEKTLPVTFMIDFHAEKVDIEFFRAGEIFDMIYDVIDPRDFEW